MGISVDSKDIFTALVVVTLIFLVIGTALGGIQLYVESHAEGAAVSSPKPSEGPDLFKATGESGQDSTDNTSGGDASGG